MAWPIVEWRTLPFAGLPMALPPALVHVLTGDATVTLGVAGLEVAAVVGMLAFVHGRWLLKRHTPLP